MSNNPVPSENNVITTEAMYTEDGQHGGLEALKAETTAVEAPKGDPFVDLMSFDSADEKREDHVEQDDKPQQNDINSESGEGNDEDSLRRDGEVDEDSEVKIEITKRAMEINEAYEVLEQMRVFNLEVLCQECGIAQNMIKLDECSCCLLEGILATRAASMRGKAIQFFKPKSHKIPEKLGPLKKFVETQERALKPKRCLTCGAPSCNRHNSAPFRKEGIVVCNECEKVFQMETLVDILLMDKRERQAEVDKMIDLYDRAMLLLKFADQFMDQAIEKLRSMKNRDNKINLSGSTLGIISGALGVAAAATIVTPAGVPLLIVSLMLGSAATSAQAGTEMNAKFFSEPQHFANRILALNGMAKSVITIVSVMREVVAIAKEKDAMEALKRAEEKLEDQEQEQGENLVGEEGAVRECGEEQGKDSPDEGRKSIFRSPSKKNLVGVGSSATALAVMPTGLPEPATMARGVRQFSRSGSGALRSLHFAQVAGGVLSGITIVLEAKNMLFSMKAIKEGSPCDKANALENIKAKVPEFAETTELDNECSACLSYFDQRVMCKDEAMDLLRQATANVATKEAERSAKVDKKLAQLVMGSLRIGRNRSRDSAEESGDDIDEDSKNTRNLAGRVKESFRIGRSRSVGSDGGEDDSENDGSENDVKGNRNLAGRLKDSLKIGQSRSQENNDGDEHDSKVKLNLSARVKQGLRMGRESDEGKKEDDAAEGKSVTKEPSARRKLSPPRFTNDAVKRVMSSKIVKKMQRKKASSASEEDFDEGILDGGDTSDVDSIVDRFDTPTPPPNRFMKRIQSFKSQRSLAKQRSSRGQNPGNKELDNHLNNDRFSEFTEPTKDDENFQGMYHSNLISSATSEEVEAWASSLFDVASHPIQATPTNNVDTEQEDGPMDLMDSNGILPNGAVETSAPMDLLDG